MIEAPAARVWLRPSRAVAVVACLAAVAAVFLYAVPAGRFVGWASSIYSDDGVVSEKGKILILGTLARARVLAVAAFFGAAVASFIFARAERLVLDLRHQPTSAPKIQDQDRPFLVAVVLLAILRLVISIKHLGDSLWYDELFTIDHYAGVSLAKIFGLAGLRDQLPNNHVLNSVTIWLSLNLGLSGEIGIRLWVWLASGLSVPVAAYAARWFLLSPPVALLVAIVVATSPVVDRFATQARGYGLAILLAPLALILSLRLYRDGRLRVAVALGAVNALLILSNTFTAPLVLMQLVHLLFEAFFPRSTTRTVGHPAFVAHLWAILLGLLFGVGLQILLIPNLLLGSLVFGVGSKLDFSSFVNVMSGSLVFDGNTFVAVLVVAALGYGAIKFLWRPKDRHDPIETLPLLLALAVGGALVAAMVARQLHPRVIAYLHVPVVLAVAFAVDDLWGWMQARSLVAARALIWTAFVAVAGLGIAGVRSSINRLPNQDVRGLVQHARHASPNRILWTSGFGGEAVRRYGPDVIQIDDIRRLPNAASTFLSVFDALPGTVPDPMWTRIQSHCEKSAERFPGEYVVAYYKCPGFAAAP